MSLPRSAGARSIGKNNIDRIGKLTITNQNEKKEIKKERIIKLIRVLASKIIKSIEEDAIANTIYYKYAFEKEIKKIQQEYLKLGPEEAKFFVEELFKICRERESMHEPLSSILLNNILAEVYRKYAGLGVRYRDPHYNCYYDFVEERNKEIDQIFENGLNYVFNFLSDGSQSFGKRCDILFRLCVSEHIYDLKNLEQILRFLTSTETPAIRSYGYWLLSVIEGFYRPEFDWKGAKGMTNEKYYSVLDSIISHLTSSYDINIKYSGVKYEIFSSIQNIFSTIEHTKDRTVITQIIKKYQSSVEELAIRELFSQSNSGKVDEQILTQVSLIMFFRDLKNSKDWTEQMKIILYSNYDPAVKKTAISIICPRDIVNAAPDSKEKALNILTDMILREQDESLCIGIINHLITEFGFTQDSDIYKFITPKRPELINLIDETIKAQEDWKKYQEEKKRKFSEPYQNEDQ